MVAQNNWMPWISAFIRLCEWPIAKVYPHYINMMWMFLCICASCLGSGGTWKAVLGNTTATINWIWSIWTHDHCGTILHQIDLLSRVVLLVMSPVMPVLWCCCAPQQLYQTGHYITCMWWEVNELYFTGCLHDILLTAIQASAIDSLHQVNNDTTWTNLEEWISCVIWSCPPWV